MVSAMYNNDNKDYYPLKYKILSHDRVALIDTNTATLKVKMFVSLRVLCLVLCFDSIFAQGRDVTYSASFSDNVNSCEGFNNENYKCDTLTLGSGKGSDEGEGSLSLSGSITLASPVKEGYQIELNIYKLLEIGEEYMYNAIGDICGNLDNEEAPWSPLIKSLNISACPIAANEYPIENMQMSLDFASDVLCHEFCGEYKIEFSILDEDMNVESCHIIGIAIFEN